MSVVCDAGTPPRIPAQSGMTMQRSVLSGMTKKVIGGYYIYVVKTYSVYILTNKRFTVLYTGVTSDIEQRIFKHKTKFYPDSFTARYQCDRLLYFEEFTDVKEAIKREKQLKKYKRTFKANLINQMNPEWKDLSEEWYDPKSIKFGIALNTK